MKALQISWFRSRVRIMPYALLSFSIIAMTGMISPARAASAPTKGESLEELHEKAKKEGGKLNLYASLSGNSIDVILPTFQKRFAGVTVDHTDATADKLIARIVAEGSPTRSAPGCRTSRR